MGKKKQIAWTLLFAPGMFLLGLVSSFLLPTAPAYTGAVFALLTSPFSWSVWPMKCPRRWLKYAP